MTPTHDIKKFVCLRLTYPTPGIEPGGRMRCAISSMSSVLATLDSRHSPTLINLTV